MLVESVRYQSIYIQTHLQVLCILVPTLMSAMHVVVILQPLITVPVCHSGYVTAAYGVQILVVQTVYAHWICS